MKITNENNEIEISESEWIDLNATHSKEYIKQLISDTIEKSKVALPFRKITTDDRDEAFKTLQEFDATSLIEKSDFYSRYEYDYDFGNTIIKMSNVGNKASDYFHQKLRWNCDSINAPSPYRTWASEKFRLTLLNGLWTLKVTKVNSTVLRTTISLRKYIGSQFKPSVAKCIYQHFNPTNILDFSTGWGDRLLAYQSWSGSNNHYTGIDPNINLKETYSKQLKCFGTKGSYNFDFKPAETSNLIEKEFYDLVFTSPPYYNIERYTQEENQSWKKYRKIDQWLTQFLFPTLKKSYIALRKGGHMVINISDVYSNHTVNKICDPMNDYLTSLGATYVDCWGMKMAKRPNSKATKQDGVFAEPVWIWEK